MDQKVSRGIRAELGASRRCRGIRGIKGHQGCRGCQGALGGWQGM